MCLGFSQITLTRPFLLMTLHFSQIGFTEDLTFTAITSFQKVRCLFYHIYFIVASPFFNFFPFFHFSIFEKSRKNVLISKKITTSALYNFQKTFLPYHLIQPFTYSIKSVKQFLLLRHLIQTFIYSIKNVTQFLLVSHYKHFLFT